MNYQQMKDDYYMHRRLQAQALARGDLKEADRHEGNAVFVWETMHKDMDICEDLYGDRDYEPA